MPSNIDTIVKTKHVAIVDNDSTIARWVFKAFSEKASEASERERFIVNRVTLHSLANEKTSPNVVLLVTDVPDETFVNDVLQTCREKRLKVYPILGKGATVLFGPMEVPDIVGCVACLEQRWSNSSRRLLLDQVVMRQFGKSEPLRLPLSLSEIDLQTLSELIVIEIENILSNDWARDSRVVGIFKRGGPLERTRLVPSHVCPRCGNLPDDSPDWGRMSFQSHFVQNVDTLRVKQLDFDDVQSFYVHPELGYISALRVINHEEYIRTSAEVHIPLQRNPRVGYGSGFSVKEAELKSILEVMERVCAVHTTNRVPIVYDSYVRLGDTAVNPSRLGLYDDSVYKAPGTWLEPFDEEASYSWIWGYDTRSDSPLLVPEQIAHYGRTKDTKKRFVEETTNGCALGGTLEEAILFGIFEVLERDGFLNMWYGKLPVPELFLGKECPDGIFHLIKLFKREGYQIRLFNTSHDIHIPSIFAVAIGGEIANPRVVCAADCHLNPYTAVDGALRELMVQVLQLKGISEARRAQGRAMLEDPSKIKHISDHIVAAGMPEAYPRWQFLLDGVPTRETLYIEEAFAGIREEFQIDSRDIRLILTAVLHHLHDKDYDVIVVNQTNLEAASGGLHVVKVIIPGMTPLTFGHGNRRVRGLLRVFELPHRMGYTSKALTVDDLNEDPIPFA